MDPCRAEEHKGQYNRHRDICRINSFDVIESQVVDQSCGTLTAQLTPSNCRLSSRCRGITVTSSISHRKAISDGRRPAGNGNAIVRYKDNVQSLVRVKRALYYGVDASQKTCFTFRGANAGDHGGQGQLCQI